MKNRFVFLYGFIILGILLSGIWIAKELDVWEVSGRIDGEGNKVSITGKDVDEIKGWMTLEEVIEGYQLNKEEIYKEFNLPEEIPVATALKDIAAQTDEALSPTIIREYITNKQQNQ